MDTVNKIERADNPPAHDSLEARLAELEAENARLRTFLEIGQIGQARVNVETGDRSGYSPEYQALYNLPAETVSESHEDWLSHIHRSDRDRADKDLTQAMQKGSPPYHSEFRVLQPDGRPAKWVSAQGGSVQDASDAGQGGEIAVTEREVSDERRAHSSAPQHNRGQRWATDLNPQILWTADANGQIVDVGPGWMALTGQTREQVLKGDWLDAVHEQDRSIVTDAWLRSLARGEPYDVEHRILLADGTTRWIRARALPRLNDEGQIVRWYGITEDIHPYRDALAALAQSEGRFRAAVEAVSGVLWTNSASGEMIGEQPGWAALTGQSYDEYQGYGWSKAVHPEDAEPTVHAWNRAVAARQPFIFEHRLKRQDGEWRLFSIRAIPVFDEEGGIGEWVGVHTDITDQRKTEDALREESRTLEVLNKVGTSLTSELDLGAIVQRVTDAATELTGAAFGAFFYNVVDRDKEAYTLYSISGVPRSEFEKFPMPRNTKVFAPTFHGEGITRSDDITADPRYGQNEPYHGMPKGHLPVRSYLAAPVISRTGEVLGGLFFGHPEAAVFNERSERLVKGIAAQAAVAVDNARLYRAAQQELDARVKAEEEVRNLNAGLEKLVEERTAELMKEVEERRRAEENLRQNEKLAALGQLTGGIAHDFNNIVQVVASAATLLRNSSLREDRRLALLDGLAQAAESARELTGRLLAFARKQVLHPRAVDLNESLKSMAQLFQHTLGSNIRVETSFADDLWLVRADKGQLESAILNLAVNARDAMLPAGGTLYLQTCNMRLDANTDRRQGEYVLLTVRDTGKGMSPSLAARAFEPFFTTKGHLGTGLGLAQVHGFVKQTGGDIQIESVEGSGTTIRFYLPRAEGSEKEDGGDAPVPQGQTAREEGKLVLVVDDNDAVAVLAQSLLEELGYRTRLASSGDEALSILRRGEPIDAVFSDVVMPGEVDGITLAEIVGRDHPSIAIVLASGYSEALAKNHNLPVRVLTKPYKIDELSQALAAALEKVREVTVRRTLN